MPNSVEIAFVVLGGMFLIIGITGSAFSLFGNRVERDLSNPFLRLIAFLLGCIFIFLALFYNNPDNNGPIPPPDPTPTVAEPDDTSEPEVNQSPIADAGPDQFVIDGDDVVLDGSRSSDRDGTIVSYEWRTTDGDIFGDVNPSVHFPVGEHHVTLTVTDNDEATDTDSVIITVDSPPPPEENQSPVADAGPDQVVLEGDDVTLDGSRSSDSDGTIVSYEWSTDDGDIFGGVNPIVNFSVGEHRVTLTVTDNEGSTANDSMVITVDAVPAIDLSGVWGYSTNQQFGIAEIDNFYDQIDDKNVLYIGMTWTPDTGTNMSAPPHYWIEASIFENGPSDNNINGSYEYLGNDGGQTWGHFDARLINNDEIEVLSSTDDEGDIHGLRRLVLTKSSLPSTENLTGNWIYAGGAGNATIESTSDGLTITMVYGSHTYTITCYLEGYYLIGDYDYTGDPSRGEGGDFKAVVLENGTTIVIFDTDDENRTHALNGLVLTK